VATIKQVAQSANVSTATVSRVLNKNPRVKSELRKRVERAIVELDYSPSRVARMMRVHKSQVIGLIISDIVNPFFTALVRAVEDVAHENGFTLLLGNSDENSAKEQMYFEVLAEERVAGIIIVPSCSDDCSYLRHCHVPLVAVDRKIEGMDIDTVVLDNVLGAYLATNHLLELGHRRIGLIGAPAYVSVGLERRQGYEKALLKHGLAIDESLIRLGDFKERGGYQATRELLLLDQRPTALFAANNLMTLGALRALQEAHVAVPQDMSVVGFDDFHWGSLMQPSLTSVRQPTYQIGQVAAQLLMRRLQDGPAPAPELVVLSPELMIRNSSAPFRVHSPRAIVPDRSSLFLHESHVG
jgi:LacI family transcriptional regulator